MKKILTILLATLLVVAITACRANDTPAQAENDQYEQYENSEVSMEFHEEQNDEWQDEDDFLFEGELYEELYEECFEHLMGYYEFDENLLDALEMELDMLLEALDMQLERLIEPLEEQELWDRIDELDAQLDTLYDMFEDRLFPLEDRFWNGQISMAEFEAEYRQIIEIVRAFSFR